MPRSSWSCKTCKSSFSTMPLLKTHMVKEHGTPIFCCDICPNIYSKEDEYLKHFEQIHRIDEKWHVCPQCGVSYKWHRFLEKHIEEKHKLVALKRCQNCKEEFYNMNAYKRHVKLKHAEGRTFHSCNLCERKFTAKLYLALHNRFDHKENGPKHFRDYVNELMIFPNDLIHKKGCKKCKLEYTSYIYLLKHLQTCHREMKFYQCCQCEEAVYNTRAGVSIHLYHEHRIPRDHRCDKCMLPSLQKPRKHKKTKEKCSNKTNDNNSKEIESNIDTVTAAKEVVVETGFSIDYIKENLPRSLDLTRASETEIDNLRKNIRCLFRLLSTVPPSKLKSNAIKDMAYSSSDSVKDIANSSSDSIKDIANNSSDSIKDLANSSRDSIKDIANNSSDSIKDIANNSSDSIKDIANNSSDSIKDIANSSRDSIKDIAKRSNYINNNISIDIPDSPSKNKEPEDKSCFECAICRRNFNLRRALSNHIKKKHSDNSKVSIVLNEVIGDSILDITSEVDGVMNQEKLKSEDPKLCKHISGPMDICDVKYTCKLCQSISVGNVNLLDHLTENHSSIDDNEMEVSEVNHNKHVVSEPVSCEDTKKNDKTSAVTTENNENSDVTNNITETSLGRQEKASYKCKKCKTKFVRRFLLINHIKARHGQKLYKCENCKISFKMESKLHNHIQEMHKTKKLPIIKVKKNKLSPVNYNTLLPNFLSKILNYRQMFSCNICKSCFPSKELLQRHIQWEHTNNVNLHKCGTCQAIFYHIEDLEMHMMTVHKEQNIVKWKKQIAHNYEQQASV